MGRQRRRRVEVAVANVVSELSEVGPYPKDAHVHYRVDQTGKTIAMLFSTAIKAWQYPDKDLDKTGRAARGQVESQRELLSESRPMDPMARLLDELEELL